MSGVEDMVHQAEKSLGLGEPNYIQRWYPGLSGNFAWCDAAITYWAWHSGNQAAVTFGGYYAYTVAHANTFQQHSKWHVDTAGIRRGDIVFFDWGFSNNRGAIDHVGLVTGTSGTAVLTIEGNTANVCARRVRHAREIVGYGRPAYAVPKPPPPKPKPVPTVQYQPFPGASWFHEGQRSPIITAMGRRLVAEGCGRYSIGPGPLLEEADKRSYEAWQRKCGLSGVDAIWPPGKWSWDKLRVPKQ